MVMNQEGAGVFTETRGLRDLPTKKTSIIGESPQIRKVWQLAESFAPTDIPILLQGETGTGKELFARALHELSKRGRGPFVPIDCAALPQSLVESELFGYERGAFTGADRPKPGRMELARGGTILLDEVGNFPFSYQIKLLRCIQDREFLPLGARSVNIKPLDVRFISATNVNLREAVKKGSFREDLYYRLNGITIDIPPLREREGDVELLVHHFIRKYGTIYGKPVLEVSAQAMELFTSYPWPGNVRELEHTVRMAIISANGVVLPWHLPAYLERFREAEDQKEFVLEFGFCGDVGRPVDLKKVKAAAAAQAERQVICELIKRVHLKKGALAKLLGIDAKTLRAKLKEIEDDP